MRGTVHGHVPGSSTCSRPRSQQSSPVARPLIDLLNAPDAQSAPARRRSPALPDAARHGADEQARPSTGADRHDGRVRGVVRRPADVPVDLVRRLDCRSRPQGYRFSVEFDQAVQLGGAGGRADLRRAASARWSSVGLDRRTGLTKAVIQIDPQYAPAARRHARDPARQDAAGGDLRGAVTRARERRRKLPDGGTLPQAQVAPTVAARPDPLHVRPRPRAGVRDLDAAGGRSRSPAAARTSTPRSRELYPFATNVDSVLAVLRRDSAATSTLLRDGGQVFSAISAVAGGAAGASCATRTRCSPPPPRRTRARRHDQGLPGRSWSRPATTIDRVEQVRASRPSR